MTTQTLVFDPQNMGSLQKQLADIKAAAAQQQKPAAEKKKDDDDEELSEMEEDDDDEGGDFPGSCKVPQTPAIPTSEKPKLVLQPVPEKTTSPPQQASSEKTAAVNSQAPTQPLDDDKEEEKEDILKERIIADLQKSEEGWKKDLALYVRVYFFLLLQTLLCFFLLYV